MSNQTVATQNETANPKKAWQEKIPLFIAITTLIFAVCATLASFKAAGYGNKMVLTQTQASDQWAFYQAKSIKETSYQVIKDTMVLGLDQANNPVAIAAKIAEYDKEIARYKQEKNDISNQAKRLETERDMARNLNAMFGQSLIFLQIGILLSSLAALSKNHYYWYIGAVLGVIGVAAFGYALLVS